MMRTDVDPRPTTAAADPGSAEPAVALRDVHFAYPDGTEVLDGISLAIPRGAIVGIVGPSGCGKSTLLSIVAGLAYASGGSVERRLDGSDRHPLSMVFQKDTVLPWLTVAENVRFFARFKRHGMRRPLATRLRPRGARRSPDPLDGRVGELLTIVGLADRAGAYPYQLSGGMRRRLAFLTAVAAEPQLLLLDEPFSSVDEPTRIGIHQDVFRIARMMRMTTLLVTHDLAEAITLCDSVVILSNRPAQIAREQAISFGDERDMLALRETSEYLSLYGSLWHALRAQIAGAASDEEATDA